MLNQRTSAALSAAATSPEPSERAAFVAGLRRLADRLERTDLPVPHDQRFLLPLHTNLAVETFAQAHGLDVGYDREGNASADLDFGPIVFRAYGYVDFTRHCAREDERRARRWAAENGMEIRLSGREA
ncbi:hypothetical protein ACGFRG_08730 [Streptomyces sp. NPDC048696]|uniref:hypothetical protein n=1 Tax=Streptomyces sp. NPDC048696 TaxID=3365585 RepID=UPI00371DEF39